MTALCVCMAWNRAGASISRSMMNFQTFLLSSFTCMDDVKGMTGCCCQLLVTGHVTPAETYGSLCQCKHYMILSVLSIMKIATHA